MSELKDACKNCEEAERRPGSWTCGDTCEEEWTQAVAHGEIPPLLPPRGGARRFGGKQGVRISPARHAEVERMLRTTELSHSRIAMEIGISQTLVSRVARELGIPARYGTRARKVDRQLRAAGVSLKDIAGQVGCSKTTVIAILKGERDGSAT